MPQGNPRETVLRMRLSRGEYRQLKRVWMIVATIMGLIGARIVGRIFVCGTQAGIGAMRNETP